MKHLQNHWGLCLAAATALTAAASAYVAFIADPDSLWWSITHDRNAHYLMMARLGGMLRSGDLLGFLGLVSVLHVWPPGSYLLVAPFLALGGIDPRVAAFPLVLVWAGSAVLAFRIARRCLSVGGNLAGLVAAAFVLASPMHRGFATDFMIEGPGTFVTLLCLFAYVRAVQEETPRHWKLLGLALTCLVVTKYNYWTLVVVALFLSEALRRGSAYSTWATQKIALFDGWSLLREGKQPVVWLIGLLLAVTVAIILNGPTPLVIAGHSIRAYPPMNLVQLLYVLVVVRLALALRPWRVSLDALPPAAREIVAWHLVPVALFFCLPRHFTTFFWFISPTNSDQDPHTFAEGAAYYFAAIRDYCHVSPGLFVAALALFALGAVLSRTMRPGAGTVFLFAVLSALLTMKHPNHQERFVMTWTPAWWIGAGLGLVGWVSLLPERRQRIAWSVAAVGAAGLVAVQSPAFLASSVLTPAGLRPELPSYAGLLRTLLEETEGKRAVALSAVQLRFPIEWATVESDGRLGRIEDRWFGFQGKGKSNKEGFTAWLEQPTADVLLAVDSTRERAALPSDGLTSAHRELIPLLAKQDTFVLTKEQPFASLGLVLRVYRRSETSTGVPQQVRR